MYSEERAEVRDGTEKKQGAGNIEMVSWYLACFPVQKDDKSESCNKLLIAESMKQFFDDVYQAEVHVSMCWCLFIVLVFPEMPLTSVDKQTEGQDNDHDTAGLKALDNLFVVSSLTPTCLWSQEHTVMPVNPTSGASFWCSWRFEALLYSEKLQVTLWFLAAHFWGLTGSIHSENE